jgi:hypothetical protein
MVNEKIFETNSSLFCRISEKQNEFFGKNFQTFELFFFSILKEHFNFFFAFLNIFKGGPFQH